MELDQIEAFEACVGETVVHEAPDNLRGVGLGYMGFEFATTLCAKMKGISMLSDEGADGPLTLTGGIPVGGVDEGDPLLIGCLQRRFGVGGSR